MASGTQVEIVDRESFEAWIEAEKPPMEWLRALSCRMALRVMPMAMVITSDSAKSDDIKLLNNLTTTMFRANMISRVASTCPTRDMSAAAVAADAAYAAGTAAAAYAAFAAAAYAAAYAADAAAYAADAAAYAADAAAADAAADAAAMWLSLKTDCRWLVDNRGEFLETEELSVDQALQAGLMAQALWVDNMLEEITIQLHAFTQSELAQETSFGLIVDWYRGVSGKGVSPFGEDKDLALAEQGAKFWEGEPLDVMDRVAEFVGWERGGEHKTLSPFEYTWNASGVIEMSGDAMARLGVPENRSPEDAKQRIDAARQLANDLVRSLEGNEFQARHSYKNSLGLYCERLPSDHSGSIYLADAEIRNLRDDLAADIAEGLNERFARRLVRVIEQHYGLRPYFPDLLNFYDDIKAGKLTESPPLEAIAKLQQYISDYTPDVFDENVSESLKEIDSGDKRAVVESPAIDKNAEISTVTLPPDPIADVDPERAKQHAASGALKRIKDTLGKVDKGAKKVERAEKVAGLFARFGEPIWEFLSRLG